MFLRSQWIENQVSGPGLLQNYIFSSISMVILLKIRGSPQERFQNWTIPSAHNRILRSQRVLKTIWKPRKSKEDKILQRNCTSFFSQLPPKKIATKNIFRFFSRPKKKTCFFLKSIFKIRFSKISIFDFFWNFVCGQKNPKKKIDIFLLRKNIFFWSWEKNWGIVSI